MYKTLLQTAVTAYFSSGQLLLFAFVGQNSKGNDKNSLQFLGFLTFFMAVYVKGKTNSSNSLLEKEVSCQGDLGGSKWKKWIVTDVWQGNRQ